MQAYLALNGQSAGPFDEGQLRAMLAVGQAAPDTLCCPVGEQAWRPLGSVLGGGGPPVMAPVPYAAPFAIAAPPANGLAITSLVLGCASLMLCCFTSVPAIVCGHLALGQIKRSGGAQGGRGLAVGGLVAGYVMTALVALYLLAVFGLGLALPLLSGTQVKAREAKCLVEARQVGVACKVYAADNDGKFPRQLDELIPIYLNDKKLLLCPLKTDGVGNGYEYFGGTDDDPAGKVLLRSRDRSASGNRIVVHVDGSGEMVHEGN